MIRMSSRRLSLLSATMLLSATATPANALVINNYFSYHLKSNPRASEIIAAINYSSNAFASLLSNDVTVNIRYDLDLGAYNYLGLSGYWGESTPKEEYAEMLIGNAAAHPENVVLSQAVNSLGQGNYADPDITDVAASSALLRANGFDVRGQYDQFLNRDGTPLFDLGGDTLKGGGLDGLITLASIDQMLFGFDIPDYDGTPNTIYYPAINTIQHEIMHVLGGGNSNVGSSDMVEALDLYRYSAPGEPDFDENGVAYFSIDGGATKVGDFNSDHGDPNGWGPNAPCPTGPGSGGPIGLFMDAISCPNQPTVTFKLDSPEGIQLMALGWNPRIAAVPEPATWTMMILGFGGIGAALRRRRSTVRVSFA